MTGGANSPARRHASKSRRDYRHKVQRWIKRRIVQSFYKTTSFWLDFDSMGRKYRRFVAGKKIEKKIGVPSLVRPLFRRADRDSPATSPPDAALTLAHRTLTKARQLLAIFCAAQADARAREGNG
jgi:hypothetical protein